MFTIYSYSTNERGCWCTTSAATRTRAVQDVVNHVCLTNESFHPVDVTSRVCVNAAKNVASTACNVWITAGTSKQLTQCNGRSHQGVQNVLCNVTMLYKIW